jgi:hypothetical protein
MLMEASQASLPKAPDGPITIDLPPAERAALEELAQLRGGNLTAAIRQALINDKFVRDRLKQGVEIVLRNPDGQLVKLNWA